MKHTNLHNEIMYEYQERPKDYSWEDYSWEDYSWEDYSWVFLTIIIAAIVFTILEYADAVDAALTHLDVWAM